MNVSEDWPSEQHEKIVHLRAPLQEIRARNLKLYSFSAHTVVIKSCLCVGC